ncbi:FHA domain-containing protein [Desulfococcaceae bacterium HSG9]|nr:FHA domain-containing protein [Desulfococcaceae bacterium HSG9]
MSMIIADETTNSKNANTVLVPNSQFLPDDNEPKTRWFDPDELTFSETAKSRNNDHTLCFKDSGDNRQNGNNPKLIVISEKYRGREYPINHTEITMGRSPRCDIHVIDKRISKHHAMIAVIQDRWTVKDLNSKNHTYVNGSTIRGTHYLEQGDQINIGDVEFKFIIPDSVFLKDELLPDAQEQQSDKHSVYKMALCVSTLFILAFLLKFTTVNSLSEPDRAHEKATSQSEIALHQKSVPESEAPKKIEVEQPDEAHEEPLTAPDLNDGELIDNIIMGNLSDGNKSNTNKPKTDDKKPLPVSPKITQRSKAVKLTVKQLMAKALANYRRGEVKLAIVQLNEVLKNKSAIKPDEKKEATNLILVISDIKSLFEQGVSYYKEKKFKKASQEWRKALALNQKITGAAKGHYEQQITQYIIEDHYRNARHLFDKGDYSKAAKYCQVILKAVPEYQPAVELSALLSKQGNLKKAIKTKKS